MERLAEEICLPRFVLGTHDVLDFVVQGGGRHQS
jgi:hypothetical protein